MANTNNPNSFRIVNTPGKVPRITAHKCAASQTITGDPNKGDLVSLDTAGRIVLATSATVALAGVAASSVAASSADDVIYIYDDPEETFEGQAAGAATQAMLGTTLDISGATGAQLINQAAVLKKVVQIVGFQPETTIGSNYTRVFVKIAKHQLSPEIDATNPDFGAQGIKADVIAESTSTAGVTIDGVLLKDSGVTGNVTGNCSGSSGSCTGNAATATLASTVTVVDTADATCSVALFDEATGSLAPKTDSGLTYNATTGMLTATGLTGPLTGNASGSSGSCTGNAATATLASTIGVLDTAAAGCSVALFEAATGNLAPKTDAGLAYAADTGMLTATGFTGPLTGNASGSSGSCTGNAATASALTAGDKTIDGDLAVTGHVAGKTKLYNAIMPVDTADWVRAADGTLQLPTNKAAKKAVCMIDGLTVGDEITKFRVVGALGASAGNHTTVDASIRKVTKGAGAVTDAAIDAITQVDVVADTALDAEETLAAVETVATDYQYYVLLTCTTAADAACDIAICGVEIDGNFKVA